MPALWCKLPVLVVPLAALVDYLIGDPWNWVHPVQVMGWSIKRYEIVVLPWVQSPGWQRLAGIVLGIGLPVLSGAIAALLVTLSWQLHPVIGVSIATIMLASCLAGRSLRRAAEDVLLPLSQGDLPHAREKLSLYVGRDTEFLSAPEIYRAVMETISENATDGVLAPLFYGLVGMAISPAAGVGLAIAYKAISTLDSMVGYRTAPYTYLGWYSARQEDVATWLPCRLTVLTIALLSRQPISVWRTCCRDAPTDPSPNAGWSECAYAAALGVQLGGTNTYQGQVKEKPRLGDRHFPIDQAKIHQGLQFTRWAFLLWAMLGTSGLGLHYFLHCQ